MAKFKFNLEPVLFQRRTEEDRCQRDLAKVLRERMILQDQLRSMQETITGSRRELASGLAGTVDIDRVSHFARFSGQVRQRAMAFISRLAVTEKRIESAREKLIKATQARKALEILREKRFRQWVKEMERREAVALDELAVQRYAREAMIQDSL